MHHIVANFHKTNKQNLTSVHGTPSQIPSFDLTKASAMFEVAISNSLRGDAFTRKYLISLLTLTLGQEQTGKVAQYPLHYMPVHLQNLKHLCPTV